MDEEINDLDTQSVLLSCEESSLDSLSNADSSPTALPETNYILEELADEWGNWGAPVDEQDKDEKEDIFSKISNSEWQKVEKSQITKKNWQFQGKTGTIFGLNTSPLDIFTFFFDEQVMEILVNETNGYADYIIEEANVNFLKNHTKSRLLKWKPVNQLDIRKYLGIIILMGIHVLPDLKLHWSRDPLYQTAVSKIMKLHRFQEIHKFFQIGNWQIRTPKKPQEYQKRIDTLYRIIKKFSMAYVPGQNLALDETMSRFKGFFFYFYILLINFLFFLYF